MTSMTSSAYSIRGATGGGDDGSRRDLLDPLPSAGFERPPLCGLGAAADGEDRVHVRKNEFVKNEAWAGTCQRDGLMRIPAEQNERSL